GWGGAGILPTQRVPGGQDPRPTQLTHPARVNVDNRVAAAIVRGVGRLLLWLGDFHRRLLPLYLTTIGPCAACALWRCPAQMILRLPPPVRQRLAAQVRAVLGARPAGMDLPQFCCRAFAHQMWNFIDLYLAERLLQPDSFAEFGGQIPALY